MLFQLAHQTSFKLAKVNSNHHALLPSVFHQMPRSLQTYCLSMRKPNTIQIPYTIPGTGMHTHARAHAHTPSPSTYSGSQARPYPHLTLVMAESKRNKRPVTQELPLTNRASWCWTRNCIFTARTGKLPQAKGFARSPE